MIVALTLWLLATPQAQEPALDRLSCVGCHAKEHAGHAASRHAVSWTNALFRHEYDDHPKAWCVSCHAPAVPEALRDAPELIGVAAAQGVDCAACHVQNGALVSRRQLPGSIHATRVDPAFGGTETCGTCHQFEFPILDESGHLERYTDEPMQNTVAEHLAADTGETCSGCHMKSAGHLFPGSHSANMLRRALEIEACRRGRSISLRVRNRGATHHVPSGGVHRHIALRLWRSNTPSLIREHFLGRLFSPAPDGKKTTTNTTLAPGQWAELTTGAQSLGGDPDEPINAAVSYVYQAPVGSDAPSQQTDEVEPALAIWSSRRLISELPRCQTGSKRSPQ